MLVYFSSLKGTKKTPSLGCPLPVHIRSASHRRCKGAPEKERLRLSGCLLIGLWRAIFLPAILSQLRIVVKPQFYITSTSTPPTEVCRPAVLPGQVVLLLFPKEPLPFGAPSSLVVVGSVTVIRCALPCSGRLRARTAGLVTLCVTRLVHSRPARGER